MAYMFGIDSVLRELKKHYLVERFYASTLSQRISLDKDSVFSAFQMVNISQNMECESNPCFFGKLHLFWCGWQAGLYFLVSIGLLTSVVSIYYYLKIIKLLMTGRNQEITPHVRNYRRSPLRSNNSIESSMIVCMIASTIPGISMNPIIAIAQDTLF
ncbi:hypothetical protein V6Z11_A09G123700 [Gossypium hirsutum]